MRKKDYGDRGKMTRRLRLVLEAADLNQTQLAKRLGIAQSAASDWFNKGALPSGDILARMFKLPEFRAWSARWLLTGDGHPVEIENVTKQEAYDLGGVAALSRAVTQLEQLKAGWAERAKDNSDDSTAMDGPSSDAL